jgi:hypothetical protein
MDPIVVEEVKKYIEKGVDDIIENKDDFIKKLSMVANLKLPKSAQQKTTPELGKTLKAINELMKKDGHRLERNVNVWPLYHLFLQSGESYQILFKKKVSDLYDIFLQKGIEGILEFEKK